MATADKALMEIEEVFTMLGAAPPVAGKHFTGAEIERMMVALDNAREELEELQANLDDQDVFPDEYTDNDDMRVNAPRDDQMDTYANED